MPQLNLAPEDLVAIAVFVGALLAFGALALAVGGAGAEARKRTRARLAAAARPVPGAATSTAPGIRLARDEGRGFERWLQRRLPSRAAPRSSAGSPGPDGRSRSAATCSRVPRWRCWARR